MKTKLLGELEKQIMDIVWKCNECSGRDVLNSLGKRRTLAYTTVATILQRLYEKGLLIRKGKRIGYVYSPKLSKEKYSRNIARVFLKRFMDSFGDVAITSFAESIDKLPKEKRKNLLELIEKYDKNR
jgi:predicted transcriptional regulator